MQPLPTGEATLRLAFQGKLNAGLRGLYRAVDGQEQLICSLCAPTDARAIFPCFDEPTFKARFAYEITTSAGATVLANSPLVSVAECEDGRKTWSFAPTRPMSTYLIALVIGNVAGTDAELVRGTPIRVWALAGKERMGAFAHRYTARLLPWYEDYFGVPYHFEKYDQVAVTGFAAGAMENSGLVLFRQSLLLMDPQTASWEQERLIASVVAHEFAHMWFGNLVTMRWWDDLWLNEAFAEWVRHKAMSQLSPDYAVWDDFQRRKNDALQSDALANTHPIYSSVATPADALELFDAITYTKGCAVLRMLESFVGEAAFQAGMRAYMREFAESNAAGADLWHSLQQASNAPVTRMMEAWITQGGYPSIPLALEESVDGTRLRLRQQRFYSSPLVAQPAGQTWDVPLVIRYEDDGGIQETHYLLVERKAAVSLPVMGALKWCYANAGEIGFYRQNPDRAMLNRLLAHMHQLTPVEQVGLLGDQWALARSGDQTIAQFLDVLAALIQSDDYQVVKQVVGHLRTLEGLLEDAGDEQGLQQFRGWVSGTFQTKLAELGFAPRGGESQSDAQRRVYVVDAMATIARDAPAVEQAIRWAEREAADPVAVDPNLAPIFVAATAQFGDAARFDHYVEIYQRRRGVGAAPQETDRYLYSFANFRAPELVNRTLRLLDENVLPQESVVPVLSSLLWKRHAQVRAWNYIKEHWARLLELHPVAISYVVEATGQLPASTRADVVAFLDAHLDGMAQQSYARALETIDQLEEFKTRTQAELVAWFKGRS
jgi:puromycin-sensitive aminopeptidase